MGWTELDDDNGYEITADDVREFEDLCRQMKNNKASSMLHCYRVTLLSAVTAKC